MIESFQIENVLKINADLGPEARLYDLCVMNNNMLAMLLHIEKDKIDKKSIKVND